jgi:DNA-binding FadR family transcriptional regulator
MKNMLTPIRAKSLKGVFIERFEELILSGKIQSGQKLPSERDLAEALGVSRPVVHEGLLELETRGLVTMKPRAGAIVNDYRTNGSLTIFASLLNYHSGTLDAKLLESLFEMRILIEAETARLAALNRTEVQLQAFYQFLKEWETVNPGDIDATTDLYFRFHHHVAMASGNLFYPMLLNSFKYFYHGITRQSFIDAPIIPLVFSSHQKIVEGIARKDATMAVEAMRNLITNGERHLKAMVEKKTKE